MSIYATDPYRIRQDSQSTGEDASTIMTYLSVMYRTTGEHAVREFLSKLSQNTRDKLTAFVGVYGLNGEWATRADFILKHLG